MNIRDAPVSRTSLLVGASMAVAMSFAVAGAAVPQGALPPTARAATNSTAGEKGPTLAEAEAMWEGNHWIPDRFDNGSWFSGYPTSKSYEDPNFVPPNPIPLNEPEATEDKRIRAESAKGRIVFGPTYTCHPYGMPYRIARNMGGGFDVRVSRNEIIMLWPDLDYRRIYMDARPHPAEADFTPTYNGHSIGHWEGKRTLVIDTIYIRGSNTQIEPHTPKPEGSHIVERYTYIRPGLIEAELTMTNPRFTRPWVVKWNLKPTGENRWSETVCVDGSRWVMSADGELVMSGPNGQPLEKAEP